MEDLRPKNKELSHKRKLVMETTSNLSQMDILKNLPIPILIFDNNFICTYGNGYFFSSFMEKPTGIVGKNLKQIPLIKTLFKGKESMLKTQESYTSELSYQNMRFNAIITRIIGTNYSSIFFIDITKLREKERLLNIKNSELEDINVTLHEAFQDIIEKNATVEMDKENLEFKNLQLRRSQKASQMIFLNTTHELKTPIVPVKSLATALNDGSLGELNPKQHEATEIIVRNMTRLNKLISDILDLSKFQTNAVPLNKSNVSIRKIIKEAMLEFDQKFKDKNLQTDVNVVGTVVFCDETRIKQVLVNLLSNAIKFTQKGSITIKGTIEKDVVLVRVKDTGLGISKEHIQKLFLPFYQVKPSFRMKHVGTGLGLAIGKNIIEKHGGKIWAESAGKGKGSDFCFTIPLKDKNLKSNSKEVKL